MSIVTTIKRAAKRLLPRALYDNSLQSDRISDETAQPVTKLIQAIRANLPLVYAERFNELSPGQQALANASIYLEYHRLDQAAEICATAFGDAQTPGDEWISTLIEAIRIVKQMPGTDVQAWNSQWQIKINHMNAITVRLTRKQ